MPISLGLARAHGFDEPFGLLGDCHRRIEHFLNVLTAVAAQGSEKRLGAEQRDALETALTYFRSAAPKHTEDEDRSVFPRLREIDDADVRAALAAIDALQADHRKAEAAHAEVDALGLRWLADGHLSPDEGGRLRELLRLLQELYRHHIAVEDEKVFPLARQVLSGQIAAEIGREMARRRGLSVR